MEHPELTDRDRAQLEALGISEEEAKRQLDLLRGSPPYLRLVRACTLGDGIKEIREEEHPELLELHREAQEGGRCTKFVPASGAATRMFRTLTWFRNSPEDLSLKDLRARASKGDGKAQELLTFLDNLERFPFYEDLRAAMASDGIDLEEALRGDGIRSILDYLLEAKGLNYGSLPKGLLKFHRYPDGSRTAFEEHLVEAVDYVKDRQGVCRLHFTVSPEHRASFEELFEEVRARYEERYGVSYRVTFSEQSRATDTIAVDLEGRPFRLSDGSLLLRPGGHGALLENLNALKADIVFIKNVDNVVPDPLKPPGLLWKKLLGGYLLRVQRRLFGYLEGLAQGDVGEGFLKEALEFAEGELHIRPPRNWTEMSLGERKAFLLERLNRPLRVCGVVSNQGEPGGGPFWVEGPDGELSLQIIEEAQIDPRSEEQQRILKTATHFNPVDIVCGLRDWRGQPFDLHRYVDQRAVIVTEKSFEGRPLRALERPGLWNGSMAHWNTIFVEVPLITFNPVKVVNDLLRETHQAKEG